MSEDTRRAFDTVTCVICGEWALLPIRRACRIDHQSYSCERCLQDQLEKAEEGTKKNCPQCRTQLIKPSLRRMDTARNSMLGILMVNCTNRKKNEDGEWEGCKQKVSLAGMTGHWELCAFKVYPCKYQDRGCKKVGWMLDQHEIDCMLKPAYCPFSYNGCPLGEVDRKVAEVHSTACMYDGILAPTFTGVRGIAVASNPERAEATGTANRKLMVNGYEFTISVNNLEYILLENNCQDGLALDADEAIAILRVTATEAGVWLSGIQLTDQEVNDLLEDSEEEQDMEVAAVEVAATEEEATATEIEGETVEGAAPPRISPEDITDIPTLKSFLGQFGREQPDDREKEEEFEELNLATWLVAERRRMEEIKFREVNLAKCRVCFTTKSAIWPEGQRDEDTNRHTHLSTRGDMLSAASEYALAGCGSCVEKVHKIRASYRRRIILTSSSLRDCFAEYKPLVTEYKGLEDHVDIISLPGGKVKELAHALLCEIKEGSEPVDVCIYGGLIDVLYARVTTEGGFHYVNNDDISEVLQSLAILSRELMMDPLGHTLRCAQIHLPPKIVIKGPGWEEAWRQVNLALRTVNDRWQELGLVIPRQINFKDFARYKHRGHTVSSHRAYREQTFANKLHLTPKCKLQVGIKIARALGAHTNPYNYSPPQYE